VAYSIAALFLRVIAALARNETHIANKRLRLGE
jgi:hypothetical protein